MPKLGRPWNTNNAVLTCNIFRVRKMKLPDFLSKRPEPKKLCRTQNLKRRFNFSFTISRTRPRLRHMGESDFYNTFPLSPLGLSGTFYGWLVFLIFSVVRRGSGVLSPATHAHPLSSSFSGRHNTNTTTHNIHGRPIRPGIRTLLTSRWCRKSVALPSTTLPSAPDRHTHTSMARRRFLPSKKSSPFGGIRTH
jgi:hypothetical protein